MNITITKRQLIEILDGKYITGEFEKHYRHNGGDQEIIFEKEGKYYLTVYRWFEDDGIQWEDSYNCDEVKEVEKIVKVWEIVKD